MRKLFLALVLALAAVVAVAPADARTATKGAVTLAARGGYVAPSACRHGPARYRLAVDEAKVPDLEDWDGHVTISGPRGYSDWTDLNGRIDGEGWHALWFCRRTNRPGTYTIRAKVDITHTDGWNEWHTSRSLATTLFVRTSR